MMFEENRSLLDLNTFAVNVNARFYLCLEKIEQIQDLLSGGFLTERDYLILGEGSNLLFTEDFNGMVIHNCLRGVEVVSEDEEHIFLRVYAGENWDEFVGMAVAKGYGGVENLSLIPGSVGSSPVQNIGAYGVEVKDRILRVEGFSLPDCQYRVLLNEDCRFAYRNSIFKNELKGRFLITSVVFKLDKHPEFNLRYAAVEELFLQKEIQDIASLRKTIIEIRQSKLPEPSEYGNAGSFFKNPVIHIEQYRSLKNSWSDISGHPSGSEEIKVPAAWLIERAGWKGVREGDVGTWKNQPLVIVNYGSASGKQILGFSEKIRKSVLEKFGIELEREVNLVGY